MQLAGSLILTTYIQPFSPLDRKESIQIYKRWCTFVYIYLWNVMRVVNPRSILSPSPTSPITSSTTSTVRLCEGRIGCRHTGNKMKDSNNVMKSTKVLTLGALGSPILVVNNTSTVKPPIKDTPNKEHLSIKDKSTCPNSYYTSTF